MIGVTAETAVLDDYLCSFPVTLWSDVYHEGQPTELLSQICWLPVTKIREMNHRLRVRNQFIKVRQFSKMGALRARPSPFRS